MKTRTRWLGCTLPITITLLLALLLTAAGPVVAAGRTEEDDFKQVEGTGNWEYTIDVTDREPGKYNILVRARDAAGNVALGGPYNVVIDPQSDLPRTTISYPVAGEAVGERLLVVGSARDDDAVGYVEVQIGDGPFVRAEGTDYWSALVPVGDLEDGPHTVRARAVDVNGTEGEPVEVPVRLDTTRPLTLPTSHESGVLISRRTTVEGTVDDANGVESLTLVAGDERRDLSLRGRGEEPRSFSFRIDPREMEDGAVVWWIEAVDGTGSIGITPFLFFVDTSAPVLEVLSPTEEDRVDAQLRIVGRATDEVGVASLTYELSTGEAGEIPLTPGDPYWSIAADLDPDTRGRISADLTIVDIAGNERSERLRYEIDSEGDMPIVSLHAPGPGAIVERAYLAGHVADDDAGATVVYSIDRGAEQTAELGGAAGNGFVVPLEGLAPGEHEVRLRAVDIYGSEGPEVRRSFTLAPPPGAITIGEIVRGDASDDYAPGFVLEAGERASLRGSIAPNGPAAAGEIAWSIGPESGTTRVDEAGRFEIGLPRASEGGAVAIELVAQSAAGVASAMTGFYVQLPEPAEDGSTPAADALLDRGLYLGLAARANDEAPIVLEAGESIRLRAIGGAPSEPELSPQADFLSVRTDGEFVVLEATGDGTVDGLEVSARVGGARVSAPAFALRTELDAPAIAIPDALIGRRVAEAGELALAVSDASGVASVAVAVQPAGSIDPAPGAGDLEATAGEDGFTVTPRLPSGDGPAVLRVVATDESGRSASLVVPFVVDTTAPQLVPVTPVADEPVNGTITVHALLSEPASTTSAVAGEEAQTTLEIDRLIVHELSVSDLDGALPITLTDSAGNTATRRLPVNADETADLPELQLQVPPPGGLVQQEFRLSGVVLDDDAPASVTYAVDDGREVTVETDGIFTIDVPMGNLEDGDHTVTVFATDIGGAQSEPIVRTFAISRSVPETDVTAPALDAYLRDELTITGTSEDPNGIAEVFVSTDNGTSFQRADGTEEWTYRLDTTLLDDGTHSVLVRAVDGAGESSLLSTTINVDNTVPVLELVEPHDGVTVSGEFLIDGRGEDGSLELVRVVAQALGSDPGDAGDAGETTADAEQADAPTPEAPAAGPPIELVAFDEPGPFAYLVDTSTLEPGWYNLRVEAADRAGNLNRVSRNVFVEPAAVTEAPQILVPSDGARLAHRFTLTVESNPAAGPVTVLADGRPIGVIPVARPDRSAQPEDGGEATDEEASAPAVTPIGSAGTGSLVIEPGTLPEGPVELSLRTDAGEARPALESAVHRVEYSDVGPWVAVDGPAFLSFVRDRPFVSGRAGYELVVPQPDPEAGDRANARAEREFRSRHEVESVEVSLDNGRTFESARGTSEWEYRLETTQLTDGQHNMVVRARFANGESAVVRHSLVVDEQSPTVRLLEPQERDTFDESVRIVGVTTDEQPLEDVSVVLREGDKARYELPSFVQGLYLDAHVLGATVFDVGAGLTFFDNNVRLQGQIGMTPRPGPGEPPQRFSGLVLGTKLLANVASFPASFLLGPDYNWLSAALAIGANFSYFTMSENEIAFTDEGLVLAGMVAQLEFPIVTLADLAVFNTYSLYTEAQLWFISSDVEAGTAFRMSFGIRADVF